MFRILGSLLFLVLLVGGYILANGGLPEMGSSASSPEQTQSQPAPSAPANDLSNLRAN